MTTPCFYKDIGKNAKDVIDKEYIHGAYNIKGKTSVPNNISFTVNGKLCQTTGNAAADLECKYANKSKGVEFTESWTTDNKVKTELAVSDKFLPGSVFKLEGSAATTDSKLQGFAHWNYKRPNVAVTNKFDLSATPSSEHSIVLMHRDFFGGVQLTADLANPKLKKYNGAFGYASQSFEVAGYCNQGNIFGGNFYQQLDNKAKVGVGFQYAKDSSSKTSLDAGIQYPVSQETTIKAKVDTQSRLGFTVIQKMNDYLKLTASGIFDCKNFANGGHKVGLGLEFTSN